MNKFLLCLLGLLLSGVQVFAQTSPDVSQFVVVDDAQHPIADGATLHLNNVTSDVFGSSVDAGLYLRNLSGATARVMLEANIEKISNGYLEVCFPKACKIWNQTGLQQSEVDEIAANGAQPISLSTIFKPESATSATCSVELSLYLCKMESGAWVKDKRISTLHLYFLDQPTAVSVNRTAAVGYRVYDLYGRMLYTQLSNLSQLSAGTYVLQALGAAHAVKSPARVVTIVSK